MAPDAAGGGVVREQRPSLRPVVAAAAPASCNLELRDGAEHLAHQNSGGLVLREKVWRRRWDEVDPQPFEHVVTGELDGQVARKLVGALSQYLAGDPLQPGQEARAFADEIGAAHGRIIELGRQVSSPIGSLASTTIGQDARLASPVTPTTEYESARCAH
jgi:hypothetical protein